MSRSKTLLFALALAGLPISARPADAQILTGAIGAVAGTATGGYITLSLIVLRAQTGHYLHDMHDLFSWTSLPVLIGAGTGTTVGIADPDRLWTGMVYGTAGTIAGTGIGYIVGRRMTDRPEGKWAGAAIGAGVGMTIGSLWGTFFPNRKILPEEIRSTSSVPIGFTIRF